jgi:hypothetical protein
MVEVFLDKVGAQAGHYSQRNKLIHAVACGLCGICGDAGNVFESEHQVTTCSLNDTLESIGKEALMM